MITIEQLKDSEKYPPIMIYSELLDNAKNKFNLTMDQCRKKYGQFSCKEWYNLLKN